MKNLLYSIRKRLVRIKNFPQLTESGGCVFLLDPKNWIDNRLLARVPFEHEQIAFAKDLVIDRSIDHIIDIGANFGLYSVILGKMSEIKVIHSFEPVKRNFHQLCGNIFSNRLDGKANLHNVALGQENVEKVIFIDPTSTGVSRFELANISRDVRAFAENEVVQIRRGDDILKISDKKLFAKIDVEGSTFSVLSGLSVFLESNCGVCQIEKDHEPNKVSELMTVHGWRQFKTIGADCFFEKS